MCRLTRLSNRKILCEILGVTLSELNSFVKEPERHYRIKKIPKPDGTERVLEIPRAKLRKAHARLKHQLSLLTLPDYVHSGVKKRSFVTNAKPHLGANSALTIDVKKFYPSCSTKAVELFFRKKLQQPKDIAEILAKISTYDGHIPTGSPVSQILAYWSKAKAFDEIWRWAKNRNLTMTLYVDDITLSSEGRIVPRHFLVDVSGILKKNDLAIKRSKVLFYDEGSAKRVTGNIILPGGKIEAPNKLKAKLFKGYLRPVGGTIAKLGEPDVLSALGLLRTIQMLEGKHLYPPLTENLVARERADRALKAANAEARLLAKNR
ncbi:MAG: reverse transcriptase family protein [Pseudomonadota bacterium]|nr:reverse transcriptase family protein [Pseudomonadota bacterium]